MDARGSPLRSGCAGRDFIQLGVPDRIAGASRAASVRLVAATSSASEMVGIPCQTFAVVGVVETYLSRKHRLSFTEHGRTSPRCSSRTASRLSCCRNLGWGPDAHAHSNRVDRVNSAQIVFTSVCSEPPANARLSRARLAAGLSREPHASVTRIGMYPRSIA
jgi:hypothetical protein